MQFQMEVCELNECDFLETKFIEYIDEEEFISDGTFTKSEDNKEKGIILLFQKNLDNINDVIYKYKPLNLNKEEFEEWKIKEINDNKDLFYIKDIYWKLETSSCILVLRNKFWFNHTLPIIQNFWDIINKEKIEGCEHRAPKKRQYNIIKSECLIDNTLFA